MGMGGVAEAPVRRFRLICSYPLLINAILHFVRFLANVLPSNQLRGALIFTSET